MRRLIMVTTSTNTQEQVDLMNAVHKVVISLVVVALGSAGCASASRVEADFGDSVRQVTKAQIYDMDAAMNPDPAAVVGAHPDQIDRAVNAHRNGEAGASSTGSPVTVNVGSTQQ